MKCKVYKNGKKWMIILENGDIAFIGKTRKSCFRYAESNNLTITEYQHGVNNR